MTYPAEYSVTDGACYRRDVRKLFTILLLATLSVTGSAFGQQVLSFEFSFSNPGARSLGVGGAFAALADDATAAYANPAGLVQLAEPEVSVEGRSWSYSTPYTQGGRADGTPTGIGLDTHAGLLTAESEADFTDLSFLSFAYPMRRWTIALYRHQLARFGASFEPQGLFAEGSDFLGTRRRPEQPGTNSTDIVNYGLSAGFRITDSLSLGLGLSYLDVAHSRQSASYLPDDDSIESFFGENSLLPERIIWQSSTRSDGSAWGLAAGFLWKATERWSLGGSVRFGNESEGEFQFRAGPASPPDFPTSFSFRSDLGIPRVTGLGIAYRSKDGRLTSSLEWDRVHYSELLEGDPDETIPDADEIHLGGEYVFPRATPIVALRLGAWLDPDHQIRATIDDPLFRAILLPGEDEIHLAAGVGLVFKEFQVDLGVDFSDLVDTASLSAVYTF
jgi:long-subunit fatty acid transport protein